MVTEQEGIQMALPNDLRSMAESVGLAMPQAATLMMEAADTIDRLDAENAKLWKLGEQYETVLADYRSEVAELRELMARMAEALGIDCEWADPDWCKSPCVLEFGCWPEGDHTAIRCPAWAAMRELGVEVD